MLHRKNFITRDAFVGAILLALPGSQASYAAAHAPVTRSGGIVARSRGINAAELPVSRAVPLPGRAASTPGARANPTASSSNPGATAIPTAGTPGGTNPTAGTPGGANPGTVPGGGATAPSTGGVTNPSGAMAVPEALTLDQAVRIGLALNPQTAAGAAGVASAASNYKSLAAFPPVSLGITHVLGSSTAPTLSGATTETFLDLADTVHTSGQRRLQAAGARSQFKAASYQLEETRLTLTQQIRDAYWGLAAARAQTRWLLGVSPSPGRWPGFCFLRCMSGLTALGGRKPSPYLPTGEDSNRASGPELLIICIRLNLPGNLPIVKRQWAHLTFHDWTS